MIAAILKETIVGETRVAATPKTILELIDSGLTVYVESGAGNESCFSDQDYIEAGAQIKEDAKSTLNGANLILKVVPPTLDEIELFPNDTIFISFFQTTNETKTVLKLRDKNITSFSMHLIPRTTLAQSMDALSSQANIAGYKAVLVGASHLSVYMPLLMTCLLYTSDAADE